MAGATFFLGLFIATTADASPKIDAANRWLRGEELQLASATQLEATSEISADESTQAPDSAELDALERDLRVHVWHGREDDDPYAKGEALDLHFRTNADAYVVVYRIDTDGLAEILWPSTRYDDGFAYSGHSYGLPPGDDGRRLTVSNKKGVEYIEAIASEYPFDLRDLAIDFAFDPDERERFDYVVAGDPFLAVNEINYAITGLEEDEDFIVTDWTHLYVESKVDYARYSCNQCHVDDDGYHPYVDNCTQVTIRYDFGWYDRWYTRFGWYPVYYDPFYVYWDSYYYQPYYNWYYPIYYRWPSYYSTIYYRPYRVYSWYDSDYYRGDHRRRYRDGATRVRPLYPERGTSIKDRIEDVVRRDTASGDRSRLGQRERGGQVGPNVASRVRSVRDERRREILGSERSQRRGESASARRNIGTERTRSRDRIVSLGPDAASRGRRAAVDADGRRGRDGRQWTRPVVRNTDRSDPSRRTLRSPGRSSHEERERPNVGSRGRNEGRNGDSKSRPSVGPATRKPTPRRDAKPEPRNVKSRDRKDKGKGNDDGNARVSRNSNRSPRGSRATVKPAAPKTRSSHSPAQRPSGSSSVKSRDRSGGSKSSASKPSSSRSTQRGSSGKSRSGSGRGGRG
jgi:hypothetical protein